MLHPDKERREVIILGLFVIFVCCTLSVAGSALGSNSKMKGPGSANHPHEAARRTETSSVEIAFLGAIKFYQNWISPIGGRDRCGFRPTCSAYGYRSIEAQGPVTGLLMTADRLIRCNIWKQSSPDYMLLPNGKLYDPPSKNLLSDN